MMVCSCACARARMRVRASFLSYLLVQLINLAYCDQNKGDDYTSEFSIIACEAKMFASVFVFNWLGMGLLLLARLYAQVFLISQS